MSNPKDYRLIIEPPLKNGILTHKLDQVSFTVRLASPPFLVKYQFQLVVVLTALVFVVISLNFSDLLNRKVQSAIGALIILSIFVFFAQEPEDSLIVMRGIGAQLISKRLWAFQNSGKFLPLNSMIDLVIHEGFHDYGQVIFYLCFLTKSTTEMPTKKEDAIKVVFKEYLPRKEILMQVWTMSRPLLFGENRRYWRRVPGQGLRRVL